MSNKKYSLLYPLESAEYKKLSPTALHDLGLDQICKQLTPKESEQNLIMNTMSTSATGMLRRIIIRFSSAHRAAISVLRAA